MGLQPQNLLWSLSTYATAAVLTGALKTLLRPAFGSGPLLFLGVAAGEQRTLTLTVVSMGAVSRNLLA